MSRHLYGSAALAALLMGSVLSGCGNKDGGTAQTAPKTVSQIDAEIAQIQNNPGMPPQAKQATLANLQRERDTAVKRDGK